MRVRDRIIEIDAAGGDVRRRRRGHGAPRQGSGPSAQRPDGGGCAAIDARHVRSQHGHAHPQDVLAPERRDRRAEQVALRAGGCQIGLGDCGGGERVVARPDAARFLPDQGIGALRIDVRHPCLGGGAGDVAIGARLAGGERHQIGRGGDRDPSARGGGDDHFAMRRHPVLRGREAGRRDGNAQPALRLGRERDPHQLGFVRDGIDLRRLDRGMGIGRAAAGGESQQGQARRGATQGDPHGSVARPGARELYETLPRTGRRLARKFEKHPATLHVEFVVAGLAAGSFAGFRRNYTRCEGRAAPGDARRTDVREKTGRRAGTRRSM